MNLSISIPDRLLAEDEVAKITRRAVQSLRNDRCQRRGIPYVKVGRRSVRYLPQDVIEFIESRRIDPEAL